MVNLSEIMFRMKIISCELKYNSMDHWSPNDGMFVHEIFPYFRNGPHVNFILRFDSLQSMASKEALRSSGGREFLEPQHRDASRARFRPATFGNSRDLELTFRFHRCTISVKKLINIDMYLPKTLEETE